MVAFTIALTGCAGVPWSTPRIDIGDNLVLGCPRPIGASEPPKTLTDGPAVLALVETFAFCEDELITHGEDREHQRRLALQEQLEKIERRRAARITADAVAAGPPELADPR